MREKFEITGCFYQIGDLNCRKYLNIKRKKTRISQPQLMVVMMNPGTSQPTVGDNNQQKEVPAIPDTTQDQIMRVMENCRIEYSRILNLSDLRITPSKAFYKLLSEIRPKQIPHSIFDSRREDEFKTLFVTNIPTIFAWGVAKELTELAKSAIGKIGINNPIGIKKNNENYAFYHPLPHNHKAQIKWVSEITKQLKNSLNSD
ncbi:DUF1643 domain-containing protein [Winogradskyella sp.]|uniref:DUF1643 domain-containing protein n=1 Tax=Winogradskyella sp. TaxID=1883156 RepID=UPI00262B510A|nr:DUF1643 domain-containing protein [Winogradskyella sp.]